MNNLSDKELNTEGVENGDVVNKTNIMDLESISFFNSDPYFNFVYKKSERLCMAIYLITDFFSNNDSIKDSMRKAGTNLLKTSLSLITASSAFRKNILNDISGLCLEIVSLSRVASNLGMTSIPNHNVLEAEVKNFISVIEERERPNTIGQSFVLSQEILQETKIQTPVQSNSQTSKRSIETEINKTEINKTEDHKKEEDKRIKIESLIKTETIVRHESGARSVMQKNERQQIILDIIKEIGESSIKDISENIKDCSEKTIQRELNTLIYGGVLKKVGERRWSKYVLA